MEVENSGVSEAVFKSITEHHMDASFHKLLGLKIIKIKPGEVTIEMTPTEELLNGNGIIHGGATSALCDTVMGMAMLSIDKKPTTVEMKLNYMSPVQVGEKLIAVGRVIRPGRTLVVAEAEVFNGDKLALKALGTFIDIK